MQFADIFYLELSTQPTSSQSREVLATPQTSICRRLRLLPLWWLLNSLLLTCLSEEQKVESSLISGSILNLRSSVQPESTRWSWSRKTSSVLRLTALDLTWEPTSRLWHGSRIHTRTWRVNRTSMQRDAALENSSPKEVSRAELSPLVLEYTTPQELFWIPSPSLTRQDSPQASRASPSLCRDSELWVTGHPNSLRRMEGRSPLSSSTTQPFTTLMALMFKMSKTGWPRMVPSRTTLRPPRRSTRTLPVS